MNRTEHIEWCKERALEYIDRDDPRNAMASLISDMQKHEETMSHPGLEMMMQMHIGGLLETPAQMRKFIEGFG
jgi:hypothetical protein